MSSPAVGVDIGGTKLLIHVEGAHHRFSTGPDCDPARIEADIRAVVRGLKEPPSCLGIAVPGLVSPEGLVVESDVLPRLASWDPRRALADLCPAFPLNDAEAALLETRAGLDPDVCALVVMVGTGIGCAVSDHGHLVRGARGWAGELGAIPVAGPDGPIPLDEAAGGAALLRRLELAPAAIIEAATRGDRRVVTELRTAGQALGGALATCINLFNPRRLTVSGGVVEYPGYFAAALETSERWSMPRLFGSCEIRVWPPSVPLVALGAARHALARHDLRGVLHP